MYAFEDRNQLRRVECIGLSMVEQQNLVIEIIVKVLTPNVRFMTMTFQ